jgi:uncharacterized protein YciI
MKLKINLVLTVFCVLALCSLGNAQDRSDPPSAPKYDAEMAKRLGADEYGMRSYILVILKTGPNRIPAGKERDEMFAGHFANMKRLATEGKLVMAGPLDGVDGRRGLFVFAVSDIEEAKKLTETDPVIVKGEMTADYHKWYGSAAIMEVNKLHERIAEKSF